MSRAGQCPAPAQAPTCETKNEEPLKGKEDSRGADLHNRAARRIEHHPPGQENARPDAVNVETGHELGAGAHLHDTDLAARARRHDYAVRVVAERADGVVTTSFYTNLPAAERKVTRTRERGLRAELVLVRVVPVGIAPEPLVADAAVLADLLGVG